MFTHIRHLFNYDPHLITIVHQYLFFGLDRRFLRSDLWLIAATQLSQFSLRRYFVSTFSVSLQLSLLSVTRSGAQLVRRRIDAGSPLVLAPVIGEVMNAHFINYAHRLCSPLHSSVTYRLVFDTADTTSTTPANCDQPLISAASQSLPRLFIQAGDAGLAHRRLLAHWQRVHLGRLR